MGRAYMYIAVHWVFRCFRRYGMRDIYIDQLYTCNNCAAAFWQVLHASLTSCLIELVHSSRHPSCRSLLLAYDSPMYAHSDIVCSRMVLHVSVRIYHQLLLHCHQQTFSTCSTSKQLLMTPSSSEQFHRHGHLKSFQWRHRHEQLNSSTWRRCHLNSFSWRHLHSFSWRHLNSFSWRHLHSF